MYIYKIRVALHQQEHNGMDSAWSRSLSAHREPPRLTTSMGNKEPFIYCPENKNLKSKKSHLEIFIPLSKKTTELWTAGDGLDVN